MNFSKVTYAKSVESINDFGLKKWEKFGVEIDLDICESPERAFAAAKQLVNEQVSMTNSDMGLKQMVVKEENEISKNDEDFNKLVIELESIKFREDAQKYIEIAGFKYNVEAKNIVNSKPSKNENN